MTSLEKKMKGIIEKALVSFDSPGKTKTSPTAIEGSSYFLKIAGKDRTRYMKNEISNLFKISKFLPFYKDYYITSLEKKGKMGMIVKRIRGTDLTCLIKQQHHFSEDDLLILYSELLKKIKVFHDNNLNHGDIKAGNFFLYYDDRKKVRIQLIDFESVNDFSDNEKNEKNENNENNEKKVIKIHSKQFDFPPCISRKNFDMINDTSFLFYQFLDIFSASLLMLYIYNHSIYKKINGRLNLSNMHPKNFVKGDSPLEQMLFYVFNFLPENNCLKKISLDIKTKKDIPNIKKMIQDLNMIRKKYKL